MGFNKIKRLKLIEKINLNYRRCAREYVEINNIMELMKPFKCNLK